MNIVIKNPHPLYPSFVVGNTYETDSATATTLVGGGFASYPTRVYPKGTSLSQLDRAAARYKAKYSRGQSRALGSGDSYIIGNGASSAAKSMYGLIKADQAQNFVFGNYGYSGRPIPAYQAAPLAADSGPASMDLLQPRPDDVFFGIWGLNDLRGVSYGAGVGGPGSDPSLLPQMQAKAQAAATWMLCPESSRVRMHTLTNSGPNPLVTFTGTWDHAGGFGAGFSFSSTVNATASFTTPVGDLLIIRFGADASASTVCSVTVDGVVVDNWSSGADYDNWSLSCLIVPLKTRGAHSVVLTQTNAGNMMIDSVDCVDTSTDFSATLLYSAPAYLLDGVSTGWSFAGANEANGASAQSITGASVRLYNNGGSDIFAAALEAAMDQLYELGFNVVNTRARVGFRPALYLAGGDTIHPTDIGHAHLAKPFQFSFNALIG